MKISTALDAVTLFGASEEVQKNPRIARNLRTAFRHYVLPHYGFPTEEVRSRKTLDQALASIKVRHLGKIAVYFEKTASPLIDKNEDTDVSAYKAVINRFKKWMQQQDWYRQILEEDESRLAPRLRAEASLKKAKKRKPLNTKPYALKKAELASSLKDEIEEFTQFWTVKEHKHRRDRALRQVSIESRLVSILSFLGWLHRYKDIPIDRLSIQLIADLELLPEFVAWGINERDNSHAWATNIGKAALLVTKWLHVHPLEEVSRTAPELEDIREKIRYWNEQARTAPKRTASKRAIRERIIPLEDLLKVLQYLRRCCASRRANYTRRPERIVMQSWQKYLIIAILTYCPVRQRELRELEVGSTLVREEEGYWVYLEPEQHKTGSRTGREREFPLPEELTEDLDVWLNHWRPKLKTEHQYVFISLDQRSNHAFGQPFTAQALNRLVKAIMFRATDYLFDKPRQTTPHDFRRIAITWQYCHGNPNQRDGLAEIMGHSVEEATKIYLQMTSGDKAKSAIDWWKYQGNQLDQEKLSPTQLMQKLEKLGSEERQQFIRLLQEE